MARLCGAGEALCWSRQDDVERPFIKPTTIHGGKWTDCTHATGLPRTEARRKPATPAHTPPRDATARRARIKSRLQLRSACMLRGVRDGADAGREGDGDGPSGTAGDGAATAPPATAPAATAPAEPPRKAARLRRLLLGGARAARDEHAVDPDALPRGTMVCAALSEALAARRTRDGTARSAVLLVSGPPGSGKRTAVLRTCAQHGVPCVQRVAYQDGTHWARAMRHTYVPRGGVLVVRGVDGLDDEQWDTYMADADEGDDGEAPALHPHAQVVLLCRSRACVPRTLLLQRDVVAQRFMGDVAGVRAARGAAGLPHAPPGTSLSVDWRRARAQRAGASSTQGDDGTASLPPHVFSAGHTDMLLTGRSVARHIRAAARCSSSGSGTNSDVRHAVHVAARRTGVLPMLHAFECMPSCADALVQGDVCATADWRPGSVGHAIAGELAVRSLVAAKRGAQPACPVPPDQYSSATQRQHAAQDARVRLAGLQAHTHTPRLSCSAYATEVDLMLQAGRGVHGQANRRVWPFAQYAATH